MRSNKRYTNETFTKRVDHEAGRHHTAKAMAEPTVCKICGDIYADRRWTKRDAKRKTARHSPVEVAVPVICPACQRQKKGAPSGYLHLAGVFLDAHRAEIENLLNNEVARVNEDNPQARIMKWEKDQKGVTVTTTTEHLAQRLGHALEKAYDGEVRYDFSHENKVAHVWWHRD